MMTSSMLFVINFWKGRRKDKEVGVPEAEVKDYLREEAAKDRISDAEFFKLVALPPSVDLHEWLATHTISFFNHVNLIYGCVSEFCTADACPAMSAPDNVQYHWTDDKGKKCKNSAPQYIDYVMSHIQGLVSDETIFPTKFDQSFPPDLESRIRRIHRFLFHVMAHLYHAHWPLLVHLGLGGHLNTTFTHFMVFTSKFELVQHKESDLLLHLFSLLLKALADPAQNPTLREGLGLPQGVTGGQEVNEALAEGQSEDQLGLEEGLDKTTTSTDRERNSSGDHNSSLDNTMTDVNMEDTLSSSTSPDLLDTTPRSCEGCDLDISSPSLGSNNSHSPGDPLPTPHTSCDTATTDTNTANLPSSRGEENIDPDLQRQFDNNTCWSSASYGNTAAPSDNSCSRADVVVTEPLSHMKTSSRGSRGSDPTSSPSEWLANLQVSAT